MSEERAKRPVVTASESGGGNFERRVLDEGVYPARIYSIVKLGTQKRTFKGKEEEQRQVRIAFEIMGETITLEDGSVKPMAVYWKINDSNNDRSSLMKMASALCKVDLKNDKERKNFNILELLDKACNVTIENSVKGDTTYNNVKGVTAPMKNGTYPPKENEEVAFVIPNSEEELRKYWFSDLGKIHPKTRKTIYESPEWKQVFSEDKIAELEKELNDMYESEFSSDATTDDNEVWC